MSHWSGSATMEATTAHCAARLPHGAWSGTGGLAVSRMGWGTLPGELKNIVDSKIERALPMVLAGGINLIDTSPAYRRRRSQAVVGRSLRRELERGAVRREELVILTHAGWLAFDRQEEEPGELLARETYPATGLTEQDFVGRVWSLHPAWLRHQLELARDLCALESFDLLMLDAPETGLKAWPRERWRSEVRGAFAACEELTAEGLVGGYGVTSLEGFKPDQQGRSVLDLEDLLLLSREAAGGGVTSFRALQLPYSLAALDLLNLRSGEADFRRRAADEGLWVGGLLGLGQGQLTAGLPSYFRDLMPGLSSAQQALQVLLSTDGLSSAMVGMKSAEHIRENLAVLHMPRLDPQVWTGLFQA